MENIYINHIAVLVCAVMSLVIGGVWWSPILVAKAWQRGVGLGDGQPSRKTIELGISAGTPGAGTAQLGAVGVGSGCEAAGV